MKIVDIERPLDLTETKPATLPVREPNPRAISDQT